MFTLLFVPSAAHAQGVGTRAPAFRLADATGQPLTLGDVLGEPLVLNVWATWCPPCREELPLFEQTQAALAEDVTFLLVNNNESADAAAQFLAQEDITLLAAFEPTRAQRNQFDLDTTREVVRDYRVRGMPTTFFIDAAGVIQAVKVGEVRQAELTELLATIGVTWPQDSAMTLQNTRANSVNVDDSEHSENSDDIDDSDDSDDSQSAIITTSINTPKMTVLGVVHGRISSQTQHVDCSDHCPTQPIREDNQ